MSEVKQAPAKDSALGLVLLRNVFYKDSYRRVLTSVVLISIINVLLAIAIIYRIVVPASPDYFPATADGRIIQKVPVSLPVYSTSYVEQWAADALIKAFRLDFIHWRSQLTESRKDFTSQGWKWFVDSLQATNNLNTLRDSKMVSSIRVTSPPKVIRHLVVDGTYMWMVKMQVMISYQNINQTINAPNSVTMIIVRRPAKDYPDRIAVNNIFMEPTGAMTK